MTVTLSTFPSRGRPRKQLASRVFASWIVFSLVVALTACCELFASTGDQAQSPSIAKQGISKADKGVQYCHGHDYHPSSNVQTVQPPVADSNHCIDKTLSYSAVSKYLTINTPDPGKKIILTGYDDLIISSAQVVDVVSQHNDPPPVSPPRYLLFHRLLIDHPLA